MTVQQAADIRAYIRELTAQGAHAEAALFEELLTAQLRQAQMTYILTILLRDGNTVEMPTEACDVWRAVNSVQMPSNGVRVIKALPKGWNE